MPIYKVGDTHIMHGGEDDKVAKVYAPGDEIELTKAEAAKLGGNVKLVKEKGFFGKKGADAPDESGEDKLEE